MNDSIDPLTQQMDEKSRKTSRNYEPLNVAKAMSDKLDQTSVDNEIE